MKLTNKHNLPKEFMEAIEYHENVNPYTGNDYGYSVSTLLAPPRAVILERTTPDLPKDSMDFVHTSYGTAIHSWMEEPHKLYQINNFFWEWLDESVKVRKFKPGLLKRFFKILLKRGASAFKTKDGFKEERKAVDVCGRVITGQVDVYTESTATILDYKSCKAISKSLDGLVKWTEQLNCYAWILSQNGHPVKNLEILAWYKDWSEYALMQSGGDYPRTPIEKITLELWPESKQKAFIEKRLSSLIEAESDLPQCNDSDMWRRPDSYAVMKNTNKRAARVLPTPEDAVNWVENLSEADRSKNKYRVDHRPGLINRCSRFCNASTVCSQWLESSQYKKELERDEL